MIRHDTPTGEQMLLAVEPQFLRRSTIIESTATGRHLYDPRPAHDDSQLQVALGCCICQHLLPEHIARYLRPGDLAVPRNGCRCCARTTTVPVVLVRVQHPKQTQCGLVR